MKQLELKLEFPTFEYSSSHPVEIEETLEEKTLRDKFFDYHQVWQRFHFADEHIKERKYKFRTNIDIARETLITMFPNLRQYIKRELNPKQIDLIYVTFETFLDENPK